MLDVTLKVLLKVLLCLTTIGAAMIWIVLITT